MNLKRPYNLREVQILGQMRVSLSKSLSTFLHCVKNDLKKLYRRPLLLLIRCQCSVEDKSVVWKLKTSIWEIKLKLSATCFSYLQLSPKL